MKNYSQKDEIIKKISSMRIDTDIITYLTYDTPKEYLYDDEFLNQLIEVNPKVKNALEVLHLFKGQEEIGDKIEREFLNVGEDGLTKLNILEKRIEEDGISNIPSKYRNDLYELAKKYENEGQYENSINIYQEIIKRGRNAVEAFKGRFDLEQTDTIYYKSEIANLQCRLRNGEELSDEELERLQSSLDVITKVEENSREAFLNHFIKLDVTIDGYNIEKLRETLKKTYPRKKREVYRPGNQSEARNYIPELSPEKRMEFLTKEYGKNIKVYAGSGNFMGDVLFEVTREDEKKVLVLERFYEPKLDVEGNLIETNNAATYIIQDYAQIDIESLNRGQLIAENKEEKSGIRKINHRGNLYYNRLKNGINDKLSVRTRIKEVDDIEEQDNDILIEDGSIEELDEVNSIEETNDDEFLIDAQEQVEELDEVNSVKEANKDEFSIDEQEQVEESDKVNNEEFDQGNTGNEIANTEVQNILNQIQEIDVGEKELLLRQEEYAKNIEDLQKQTNSINEKIMQIASNPINTDIIKTILQEQLVLREKIINQLKELEELNRNLETEVTETRTRRQELLEELRIALNRGE